MRTLLAAVCLFTLLPWDAHAQQYHDITIEDRTWLRTITTPYDDSSQALREASYKVYTDIFDFDGEGPITKGVGGKYTHHRGLFIGWMRTHVKKKTYDTWHMRGCFQRHVKWHEKGAGSGGASQSETVEWCDAKGKPFIRELRVIKATLGDNGVRLIDFRSELTSLNGTIRLEGDLQHAGMQLRLADEVSEHEDSTSYLLPEGAYENDDDEVIGAWWVMCSAIIEGQRYWIMHMTASDNPTGQPIYSIRRYGRFGAFFEPTLAPRTPVILNFRVAVSKTKLSREDCQRLYNQYSGR